MRIGHRALNGQSGHEAGRKLLAEMYREKTGQPLPEIRTTDRGKPYFVDSGLHFSISHTREHVFCVLLETPVGIDAEQTDRKINAPLVNKVLSPGENERYNRAQDKQAAFLKLWVLKEAYAKLTGRGWGNYLYETDFDPEDARITEMNGCYVAVMEETEDDGDVV